jgi:hypothetical protein
MSDYKFISHDQLVASNNNLSLNKLNNAECALILLQNDPKYSNYQFIKDSLLNIQMLKNTLSPLNNQVNNLTNTSNLNSMSLNNTSNLTTVNTDINSLTSNFENLNVDNTTSQRFKKNYTYIKYNFLNKNNKTQFLSIKYNINSKNNYYVTNKNNIKIKVTPNIKNIYVNKYGIHFDGNHISFLNFFNDNKDHILKIKKDKDENDLYENTPNQH